MFGSIGAWTQQTGIRERTALKAECCVASRLLSLQPTANKLVCFIYDVKTVMLMKLFFWHYTLTNIDNSNHLQIRRSHTKWVKSWILQQQAISVYWSAYLSGQRVFSRTDPVCSRHYHKKQSLTYFLNCVRYDVDMLGFCFFVRLSPQPDSVI